jgi:cell division protein FtsL
MAAVGLAFLYLWQSWSLLELSTQISDRRIRLVKLQQEIENLEYTVSSTFTLERIRQVAKEQLGMVEPEIDTVIIPLKQK